MITSRHNERVKAADLAPLSAIYRGIMERLLGSSAQAMR